MKTDLFELMNPMMDNFFEGVRDFPMISPHYLREVCKANISETEGEYTIEVDLPGYAKEDISIELKKGIIKISAKKEKNEKKYIHQEKFVENVSREFSIGENIDETKIEAKLENGILEIDIPKKTKEPETSNKIEIK